MFIIDLGRWLLIAAFVLIVYSCLKSFGDITPVYTRLIIAAFLSVIGLSLLAYGIIKPKN